MALAATLALGAGAASAQEPPPAVTTGTITIVKDTSPETFGADFCFSAERDDAGTDPPGFCLEDDGAETMDGLAPGQYTFVEQQLAGWTLDRIACGRPSVRIEIDRSARRVSVDLLAGDDIVCTFYNVALPPTTATPALTATLAPTATSPAVPTATATPLPEATPAPTQTPVVVTERETVYVPVPVVQTVEVPVQVQAPVQAPAITTAPAGRIVPPSTGDAGLTHSREGRDWTLVWALGAGVVLIAAGALLIKVSRR